MTDRTFLFKKTAPMLTSVAFLICSHQHLMAHDNAVAETQHPQSSATLQVKHILGFQGVSNNANGELSIQHDSLLFQKSQGSSAEIPVSSIQEFSLGQEDRQVGGIPMTLAKSATPYGGGRLMSLFTHKKFDTVTLEYSDPNGGFHGAIFQLEKGKAQVLASKLEASGVHVGGTQPGTTDKESQETKHEAK